MPAAPGGLGVDEYGFDDEGAGVGVCAGRVDCLVGLGGGLVT